MFFKLIYMVPASHLEHTKAAIFEAGAGNMENYSHCCWQILGQGQFKPNENADPHIGMAGVVESVEEYRVETIMPESAVQRVLAALKAAHPYEVPAIDVVRLEDV